MSRVLVFSCTHFPYNHKDSVKFLKKIKKSEKCDIVVCLGDLFDYSALSTWDKEPESLSNESEYVLALEKSKELFKEFPKVLCTHSNHDLRPFRAAARVGMSPRFLKKYSDILDAPNNWDFREEFYIEDVVYSHGEKSKTNKPGLFMAKKNFRSSVIGHYHSNLSVEYYCNDVSRIFGMTVGCLIDNNAIVFRYNRSNISKPIIGCGLVIDGKEAVVIPMELGSKIRMKK